MTTGAMTLGRLGEIIHGTLDPIFQALPRYALIGFPHHDNVGDSLIWLGEMRYLRRTGAAIVYMCDRHTYEPRSLERRLGPDGAILIHGGGNLGDLWPNENALRERVISEFPDHRIIQFPQSIHFNEPKNAARSRDILGKHRNFTLLARDLQSLHLSRELLGVNATLCPDMALALEPLPREIEPTLDAVWLARSDHESRIQNEVPDSPLSLMMTDWVGRRRESSAYDQKLRANAKQLLRGLLARRPVRRWVHRPRPGGFDEFASEQVERGHRLLSRGRVVISDRLHAHILSLLAGIPNVLLDNSYGKLRSFFETWTHSMDGVWWANTPEEALRLAEAAVTGSKLDT